MRGKPLCAAGLQANHYRPHPPSRPERLEGIFERVGIGFFIEIGWPSLQHDYGGMFDELRGKIVLADLPTGTHFNDGWCRLNGALNWQSLHTTGHRNYYYDNEWAAE